MPSPNENYARTAPVLHGKDLAALSALSVDDVNVIIRVTALGVKPSEVPDLIRYARTRPDEPTPPAPFSPGIITIQAYSFVRDRNQYSGTYGISSERAATLRDQLDTEPQPAMDAITEIVSAHLRSRGSTKRVTVVLGSRRGAPPPNQTGQTSDDGLKALIARQTPVAGIAGTYQFPAVETDRPLPQRFRCQLGGGLVTLAQSKRAAQVAARLVKIFGREDTAVVRYVAEYREGVAYFGDDIQTDYDGKGSAVSGPDDPDGCFEQPDDNADAPAPTPAD